MQKNTDVPDSGRHIQMFHLVMHQEVRNKISNNFITKVSY